MIISASRRTDIPAFYGEWFLSRLREGYALVRNPFNPRAVSRVALTSDTVVGIVFWSKNPAPLLPRLSELDAFAPYYFQFTLTGYGRDVEPFKTREVVETFRRLSGTIGAERVIWRYDPILLNAKYTLDFHVRAFEQLCNALNGCTNAATISFIVEYRSIRRNLARLNLEPIAEDAKLALASRLVEIAAAHNIEVRACADGSDLASVGVAQAQCVDPAIFERTNGVLLDVAKDRTQREGCNCALSVDVGEYDTCRNGCLYCYANHSSSRVAQSAALADSNSPLIVGQPSELDKITDRNVR